MTCGTLTPPGSDLCCARLGDLVSGHFACFRGNFPAAHLPSPVTPIGRALASGMRRRALGTTALAQRPAERHLKEQIQVPSWIGKMSETSRYCHKEQRVHCLEGSLALEAATTASTRSGSWKSQLELHTVRTLCVGCYATAYASLCGWRSSGRRRSGPALRILCGRDNSECRSRTASRARLCSTVGSLCMPRSSFPQAG